MKYFMKLPEWFRNTIYGLMLASIGYCFGLEFRVGVGILMLMLLLALFSYDCIFLSTNTGRRE